MNMRPTRTAPPPSDVEDGSFTEAPPREAIIEHQISHATPAIRQQPRDPAPSKTIEPAALPETGFAKLAGAIAAVMAEIKPVEKSGYNKFHNYWHARIGDLSSELTPLMGKHGIVIFQNEIDRSMFDNDKVIAVRYQFTIVHSSGEIWPERPVITGMSACRNSKDGFDDKSFNKAHTAARKYFLLSLFQIPTEDADDADRGDDRGGAPRPQRRAPSPDGTIAPHLIPIVNGEEPKTWAERFTAAMAKSKTAAEVDQWYDANFAAFEKLKKADKALYDTMIDAMDMRTNAIAKGDFKEPDPPAASEKPPAQKRQRAVAPPPAKDAIDVTTWLQAIENAYSSCEDTESLIEAQGKYMTPDKSKVPEETWRAAVALTQTALKRIEAGEGT